MERIAWKLFFLKMMESSPVAEDDFTGDIIDSPSFMGQFLTTLMQAVMVSLMSLMVFYAIAYVKSRALARGGSIIPSEQRLFRLDQHPRYVCQTQPPQDDSKRRKIADLESIPLWQVPKVKSHRTNH